LPVQRLYSRCDGETGGKSSRAELGSSTAGCEDRADSDVFDKFGVDLGAFDEGFEGAEEEVGGLSVFEATFAALCEWCAEGACYNDLQMASLV